MGSSTGVTAGICNGALACCNWEGKECVRFQHDGQQVNLSSITVVKYVGFCMVLPVGYMTLQTSRSLKSVQALQLISLDFPSH